MKKRILILLCVLVLTPLAAQEDVNHAVRWAAKSQGVREEIFTVFIEALVFGAEIVVEFSESDSAAEVAENLSDVVEFLDMETILKDIDIFYEDFSNWGVSNEDALYIAVIAFIGDEL